MPTKIMLKSVIANNDEEIHIYCLFDELTEESISSVRQLYKKDKVDVSFVRVNKELFKDAPVHNHFSKESYFRLFAHKFLNEAVDRILWLDSDTIVNGSLKEFYYQDFEGKLFVAVEDMALGKNEAKHKALSIPLNKPYINSGVLLMNLKQIRLSLNDELIFDYIKRNHDLLEWVDQDVYNGLFYNEFKVIKKFWYNYFAIRIDIENKKTVYNNAKIIHFCGTKKPWKNGYGYYGFDIYWKYGLLNSKEYNSIYKRIRLSHMLYKPLILIKKSLNPERK